VRWLSGKDARPGTAKENRLRKIVRDVNSVPLELRRFGRAARFAAAPPRF
jgi:hypothetical protein